MGRTVPLPLFRIFVAHTHADLYTNATYQRTPVTSFYVLLSAEIVAEYCVILYSLCETLQLISKLSYDHTSLDTVTNYGFNKI